MLDQRTTVQIVVIGGRGAVTTPHAIIVRGEGGERSTSCVVGSVRVRVRDERMRVNGVVVLEGLCYTFCRWNNVDRAKLMGRCPRG